MKPEGTQSLTEIEFTFQERCPSVQGHRVGDRLGEWRAAISAKFQDVGLSRSQMQTPEDHIRAVATQYPNGQCRVEAEFRLRATKNVTDLDRMVSFIVTCFRTELTEEAIEIETAFGTRPWFYYDSFALPAEMDFWRIESHRYDGQTENQTSVRINRIHQDTPK